MTTGSPRSDFADKTELGHVHGNFCRINDKKQGVRRTSVTDFTMEEQMDNEDIKKMYENDGGPEIRHGDNTDTGVPTIQVVIAVLLVLVIVLVSIRLG